MKPVFDKTREFLEHNDAYGSDKLVDTTFRVSYEPQTLTQSIKNLLNVYSTINKLGSHDYDGIEDFHSAMDKFSVKFSEMVDCVKSFASVEDEEKDMERLKFILNRGFREFQKLYELQPDSIHDIKQKLPDYLNDIFEEKETKQTFLEKFIDGLDSELLPKALPKL